jgi:hypothetical protein
MTEVYTLHSESGDEYKLQFTTDRSDIIADNLLDQLNAQGIEVVEIGLARVKGKNITSHKVLHQIEDCRRVHQGLWQTRRITNKVATHDINRDGISTMRKIEARTLRYGFACHYGGRGRKALSVCIHQK